MHTKTQTAFTLWGFLAGVLVSFVVFMLLSTHTSNKAAAASNLDMPAVTTLFNEVGYHFFPDGYGVYANVSQMGFLPGSSGEIQGYLAIAELGNPSFSSAISGFIFNSTGEASGTFSSDTKLISFLAYQTNASAILNRTSVEGSRSVKFYDITTKIPVINPNNTVSHVSLSSCGSAFYYKNVLFVGHSGSFATCNNVALYLLSLANETYPYT